MGMCHFEEGLRFFEEGSDLVIEGDFDFEEGLRFFWEGSDLVIEADLDWEEVVLLVVAVDFLVAFFDFALSMTALATSSVTSTNPSPSPGWVALSRVALSEGVERKTKPEALSRSSRMSAASSQHVASGIGFPMR